MVDTYFRSLYSDLTEFPEHLLDANNKVDAINLFSNKISSFPPETRLVSLASRLKEIDLTKNAFTSFPREILFLTNLEALILSENPIHQLPEDIDTLSNLTSLRFGGCELTSLPSSLSNLANLQSFRADKNEITQFPIFHSASLFDLDLSENKISGNIETRHIERIPKLETLVLCQNRITGFHADLGLVPALTRLDLSYNDIPVEDLIFSSPHLSNVAHIDLNGNSFLPHELPPYPDRKYPIRVDDYDRPTMISEKLYLGSWMSTRNKHFLKSEGITHIFCVADRLKFFHEGEFEFRRITIDDCESEDIKQHFLDSIKYMNEIVGEPTKVNKVLVHCAMGISRSATIVIAYLMSTKKYTFEEAYEFVREKRPIICPNSGFREQLVEFGDDLKAHRRFCQVL
eukprot:TRINITY_DN1836_c0_g1_i1.p1 TRINITY_DN1836_c0_g1~~TRINITY_DN1836_c0_g1_i1.p1  ORF type:complete len:401 (+),score=63.24 TRINITY_DN1836_c0_g1_i1:69-1271(+)